MEMQQPFRNILCHLGRACGSSLWILPILSLSLSAVAAVFKCSVQPDLRQPCCFLLQTSHFACVKYTEFSFLHRTLTLWRSKLRRSHSTLLLPLPRLIPRLYCGYIGLSISVSCVIVNRLHGVLTLQESMSSLCPQWVPRFTVMEHLAAALFVPSHSLGVGEGVCVFPRPERALPKDYPSFCSEPLELLTQLFLSEKLCICIDSLSVCVCLSYSLHTATQATVAYVVDQLAFDNVTSLHLIHCSSHSQKRFVVTLHCTTKL